MSVAIFDDDGDYGAVIVSGANLAIVPEQVADDLLSHGKVVVLQNEIPEGDQRGCRPPGSKTRIVHGILNAAPARPFTTGLPGSDWPFGRSTQSRQRCWEGGPVSSLETASGAAKRLATSFKSVVVTAGGDGVAYFDRSGRSVNLPGIKVLVASTHGAGDAFVGTLAARLAFGEAIDVALSIANKEAANLVATPEDERVNLI